jgi:hypothetical protein
MITESGKKTDLVLSSEVMRQADQVLRNQVAMPPVVFIKDIIIPTNKYAGDPLSHFFVVTNSGKLPARNVKIVISMDLLDENNNLAINVVQSISILDGASIYPDSNITMWIPKAIRFGSKILETQTVFDITYEGDSFELKSETMKFIFTADPPKWTYVRPQIDILKKM